MSLASEISIIIPVYNDAPHIGKSLDALEDFIKTENFNTEIIIINDGGQDGSVKIIEEKSQKYPGIHLINRTKNMGKGASIREGIKAAIGKFIIFTDADLPYGVNYFKKIIELLNNGADLVIANRNTSSNISFLRNITHWCFSFVVRKLLHLEFTDTQAGLKGIHKEAADKLLPKLSIDRFAFDLELLVAAKRANFKIKEIPVALENIGKSNISVARDSFQMLKDIVKIWIRYK